MKIINEIQGTESWREWRHRGIGASDIAKVMKVHPTESPLKLYNEICGFSEKRFVSAAMQRGNDEEPKAIAWLEDHFKVKLEKICAEDEEVPYMRCSFDGINIERELLIEIKTPYNAEKLLKMIDGDIPIEYVYQIQYQMMIAGFSEGYIGVWDGVTVHLHLIEADVKLHTKMRKAVIDFWNDLIIGKEPPLTNLDFEDISKEHTDYLEVVKELEDSYEIKKRVDKKIKEIKTIIEPLSNQKNTILFNMQIKYCEGNTTYDLQAMKEDGIDIDRYKKPSSPYYRYSFKK